MKKKQPLSSCCGKPMKVEGLGDFHDKDRACTQCTGCNKPCDPQLEKKETKKEQPEWEEALNKILWSNLALKEEHARPMKRELQDDLKAFIRKVEQEAYERGLKEPHLEHPEWEKELMELANKTISDLYIKQWKEEIRAEFKKELMGKFQFLPIWTISKKAIIKIIEEL